MSASPRKRSRAEPAEDTKAECPFEVKYESEDVKTKARKAAKRRKQAQQLGGAVGADADEDEIAKVQPSPFTPSGSFKNDENMDLRYWVEPRDKWMAMTRYNSFVLNSAKYFSEGFIYISNGMASPTNNQVKVDENGVRQRMPNEWVGRILEIRAADEHHVYARIYWMYWPEELPVQTKDDGKFVARAGRQPYHGVNELIASNHSTYPPSAGGRRQHEANGQHSGRDQRRQRHGRGQGQAVVRGERRRDPRRPLLATSARRSHPQPLGM
ncbi:hypothetical protein VDGD_04498 [Verticillium dahliae]|nr:hypothetical protein VDGD_04498 [Verticillium dahliae]